MNVEVASQGLALQSEDEEIVTWRINLRYILKSFICNIVLLSCGYREKGRLCFL
jgi:hypothetical protein